MNNDFPPITIYQEGYKGEIKISYDYAEGIRIELYADKRGNNIYSPLKCVENRK